MLQKLLIATLIFCTGCVSVQSSANKSQLSALIIDGQNNHSVWPKSTVMMKHYLEETGLFKVDVYRTKPTWRGEKYPDFYQQHSSQSQFHVKEPIADPDFAPKFSDYDVVISNFGYKAASWPDATKKAFEDYMSNGGGFVSVHAADNSFPKWPEFNKMIGVGGWGNRNEKAGPHLYYNDADELIVDTQKGKAGTHGKRHELKIRKRNEHLILAGLPDVWMHTADECYGNLRGPALNMTILATALCPLDLRGTGNHEPMLMVIDYGKGRVFHTALGHDEVSLSGVGFITTLQRGTQWAATGKVTQIKPANFPSAKNASTSVFIP